MNTTMLSFTQEIANQLVSSYKDNTLFILTVLEPIAITSKKYRIQIYSRRLNTSIISIDFEDFYIVLNMLQELEKEYYY